MTKVLETPQVVCPRIHADGVSVEESTLMSSDPYHFTLELGSVCSASSSVFAETGAPDIRQLTTLSANTAAYEPQLTIGSLTAQEPHPLLLYNDDHDNGDGSCTKNLFPVDIPPYISLPAKVIQDTYDESVEAFEALSPITSNDFNVHPNPFGFSQRPRNHRHYTVKPRQQNVAAIAPIPSRYRRPVDSLLVQKDHIAHESRKSLLVPWLHMQS